LFRFETIQEMIEDPKVFVCVLIDEVESLSAARKSNSQVFKLTFGSFVVRERTEPV